MYITGSGGMEPYDYAGHTQSNKEVAGDFFLCAAALLALWQRLRIMDSQC